MGERKGQNHYYPPDYDPRAGSLNAWLGTHALRERARKLHLGILIIRFEMPFNIWCEGCGNHVGMGVRYNAEKTKIGMYYTTPVYQFRMKCHLCDNHFEIKTDPGNLFDAFLCEAEEGSGAVGGGGPATERPLLARHPASGRERGRPTPRETLARQPPASSQATPPRAKPVLCHTVFRHTVFRHTVFRHTVVRHAVVRHAVVRHAFARLASLRYASARHTSARHASTRLASARHASARHAYVHHASVSARRL